MAPPAILVEDLVKRYDDVEALRGVSLQVPPGHVLGLLGPNGAGKTTAVRILTTLLAPDGGRAEVLGVDVTVDPERVRASIGLAGQNAAVDETLTGRENLRLVGRLTHLPAGLVADRSHDLLERFELLDAGDRIVRTYSGGMRRRLDLAAALVHEPPVLFLDEPTTGLDPRSRQIMWQLIRDLVAEGVTILLTTQYLEEADQLADRIAVLDQGRIVAEGTPQELKRRIPGAHIRLRFADAAALDAAERALREGIRDDQELALRVPHEGGIRSLRDVLARLGDGVTVEDLSIHTPDLDDVFFAVTGHASTEPADHQEQEALQR
jgi:ABC-2 type transport system ATP-binding protein